MPLVVERTALRPWISARTSLMGEVLKSKPAGSSPFLSPTRKLPVRRPSRRAAARAPST